LFILLTQKYKTRKTHGFRRVRDQKEKRSKGVIRIVDSRRMQTGDWETRGKREGEENKAKASTEG
jgi:hypothetical protein